LLKNAWQKCLIKKCSFGTVELIVPSQKIKNNHAMQENVLERRFFATNAETCHSVSGSVNYRLS